MTSKNGAHVRDLEQRLAEAEATITAMVSGQIDAVVDPTSKTPVLLAKAQVALRKSEERYRSIVETTNEGIWTADRESRITFVNRRMCTMLGYSIEEVIGQSLLHFVPEASQTRAVERLARSREGILEESEVGLVRKDGSELWVLLHSSAIRDIDGTIVGTLGMMTDKTGRRETEAALRTSEARFRRLWESGIILITISDLTGKILEINDAGLRMLGYSREELAGRITWGDLTPDEWRKDDAAARALLMATGVATPWEKELVRKDGSRVSVLAARAIIDGVEGITIAVDLSDRKRAERLLLERMRIAALTADVGMVLTHEDSLEPMLDRCADAIAQHLDLAVVRIWLLEPKTNVLELHASAGLPLELDGPHAQIPVGKLNIGRIANERRSHRSNELVRDARRGEPVWDGVTAFAGHPLIVNDKLLGVIAMFARKPISDAVFMGLGAIAAAIAVGIQRKLITSTNASLEAKLRQSQKMEAIGRLAGGIAHDFNNILSVILSYGEFLLEDLKPQDPARVDVAEICSAGRRAAALTQQLLMFSRQQVLEPKVLDLGVVTASMEDMLRRVLGEDVELVLRNNAGAGRVLVDPGNIEQVIMNLVVNARDAMPDGGRLTIETKTEELDAGFAQDLQPAMKAGPHVVLTIRDTGTGIDPATCARIFEPFFTTKSVGKGTGMGLSTVFGIVEQSNGAIRVQSEVGTGSEFSIYLPHVDRALDTAVEHAKGGLRGTETILLVEDEDQVRTVASAILKRHGYTVIQMRSAAEATAFCQQRSVPVDLLLTDVVMPQMSGPALARALVEVRPRMRVLCMSGYSDDTIYKGLLQTDFALLQKPFTSDSLTRKIREVLDVPRSI